MDREGCAYGLKLRPLIVPSSFPGTTYLMPRHEVCWEEATQYIAQACWNLFWNVRSYGGRENLAKDITGST